MPGGRPTAERAAAIKASVVAATMDAFAAKGGAFSMDEVATLAGVSKQAIYRRWRSKIDLVVEAIECAVTEATGWPLHPEGDPVAALEALAWRNFGDAHARTNRLHVYLQVESFRNAELRDHLATWHSRFVGMYRNALRAVDAAGRRVPGDMDFQIELLMDLLSGGAQRLALTGATSRTEQRRCFTRRWETFRAIAVDDRPHMSNQPRQAAPTHAAQAARMNLSREEQS